MDRTKKKRLRESAGHYHSLGLLCRQQAARYPEASWRWLSEAERFEHLAAKEVEQNLTATLEAPRDKRVRVQVAPRQLASLDDSVSSETQPNQRTAYRKEHVWPQTR
jgi:hypothetical protein